MKKTIAIALAVTLCLAALAGCAPKTNASATVTKGIEALKSLDRESFDQYWGTGAFAGVQSEADTDDQAEADAESLEILGLIVENLSCNIVDSEEDLDAGTATVTAEVSNHNMETVVSEWITTYFSALMTNAFLPEAEQYTEEESNALAMELFREAFSSEELETITKTVTFNLTLNEESNEWQIVKDDNTMDTIMGGFVSAMNGLSEGVE